MAAEENICLLILSKSKNELSRATVDAHIPPNWEAIIKRKQMVPWGIMKLGISRNRVKTEKKRL